MTITFPQTPTINQQYTHTDSNTTFKWDGNKWVAVPYDPKITGFIPLTGGTATGPITLPASNPTTSNQAVRKAWIDNIANTKITQAQADARVRAVGDPTWVNVTGDTRSGDTYVKNLIVQAGQDIKFYVYWTTMNQSFWMHYNGTGNSLDLGYGTKVILKVLTNGQAQANASWKTRSDINGKRNVEEHEDVLSKLKTLSAFEYTIEHADGESLNTAGVSAQEVQKVFPELVSTTQVTIGDKTGDGNNPIMQEQLCINLDGWIAVLAQGTLELKEKLNKVLGGT